MSTAEKMIAIDRERHTFKVARRSFVDPEILRAECGWHVCSFDVATSEVCSSPCTEPLRTHRAVVVNGTVYVERKA